MKRTQSKFRKGFTLVEMLGVLAIIAILISVIAVGVLAAINRAAIVATASNCKNMETAVVGFVALPASGGTIPLSQGPADNSENSSGAIRLVDANDDITYTAYDNTYTLTQVMLASGLIDRQLQWRVGRDGSNLINSTKERTFRISKNAYNIVSGQNGNEISLNSNHAAASIVDATALTLTAGPDAGFGTTKGVDFNLNGITTGTSNGLQASRCAYVVLKNVSLKDACSLSRELNSGLDDTDKPAFKTAPETTFQARGRFIFAKPATGSKSVDCYYYLAAF